MRKKTKSKQGVFISLVTFLLTVGVTALLGQPITLNQITKEIFGFQVGKAESTGICKPNGIEKAKVIKVVDGDTIEVSGGCKDKIRLLYIDTPETVKPNTPVQCYGPEASSFSKKSLKVGSEIFLKSDKESEDRYGRSLRILYKNENEVDNFEKSYNYELVSKGYGVAKFYSPNSFYKKEMLAGEQNAKENSLGIWKNCKL
jgi:micrococcal nuclease